MRNPDIPDVGARAGDGDGRGHRLAGAHALQHRVGPDTPGQLEDRSLAWLAALGDDMGGAERPGDLLTFLVPGHGDDSLGAHP